MDQLKILAFAIDIQAYMKLRSSENNKNSIFGRYNKTEKLDASNKLLKLLQGENIILSSSDISTIRDGRLGNLCRTFAKHNGFATLRDFLKSEKLKQYTKENISNNLTVDVDKYSKYLSKQIKLDGYQSKDTVWSCAHEIQNPQPLMVKIDGLLDLCIGFCKEQVSDKTFIDTPFKYWELVSTYAEPSVMEFKVLGNFYYVSNRDPTRGELRSYIFLDIIKKNPNLNISSLMDKYPFDLVCMIAQSQKICVDLASKGTSDRNRDLTKSMFKKYYQY